ncbi:hypothetical protein BOTBODRAFT_648452 [Botryobasidium botryosum FD-172 SS1]|uniref:Fe2OG dioxygenase domain-containing protein n=1 Tax=Botryobasidium botryosum (strain FD-172 SS1) TaxID=930990 RepID=A0A067MR79_BOTB1|nr:hypothetical protein BOTBODRAFT_648452 [Botryobasidium botryosum FD-172 SS1]
MASEANFSAVPVLDFTLLDRGKKDQFIAELRHAVVNVGFLYLANPPVSKELIDSVVDYAPKLFALPQEAKDKLVMRNSPHFLGYNRLGSEFTKGAQDQREQFDIATEYENRWTPGQPDYLRLWGPSQWPDESEIPGFRQTFSAYLRQVEALSFQFTSLLAEALSLPPDAFDPFFNVPKEDMQHRGKVVKYPSVDQVSGSQGVGPHFDAGFLTFLLQASDLPGLQVQNTSGEWIDVLPKPHTLVVNIGKGLETVTQGVTLATSHRVISPPVGSPARYSIPFFQNISLTVRLGEMRLDLPDHILKLKEARGGTGKTESVNFSEYASEPSGLVSLIGRIKSHPDVGERHYPKLFRQLFPQGAPKFGDAY